MKNFVQPGDQITVAAPSGGVNSGDGVLIGKLFGIASYSAVAGADVEIRTEGVFDMTAEGAVSGQAFTVGAAVYWDNTNKRVTATSAGNTRIGAAVAAKATSATVARVRLDGYVA